MSMHILTLVVSFTYSIPRFHWPHVMVELLEVAVTRRDSQATVLLREQVYDAGLMNAFMEHVSRWRHVLSDIRHYIGGYRAPPVTEPESWNEECDSAAALIDHRRLWGSVMQQLRWLSIDVIATCGNMKWRHQVTDLVRKIMYAQYNDIQGDADEYAESN